MLVHLIGSQSEHCSTENGKLQLVMYTDTTLMIARSAHALSHVQTVSLHKSASLRETQHTNNS